MRWRLKSTTSRLFAQPFVQAHIKENIKDLRHWHFLGESTGDHCIPLTKGQQSVNVSIWSRHHDLLLYRFSWKGNRWWFISKYWQGLRVWSQEQRLIPYKRITPIKYNFTIRKLIDIWQAHKQNQSHKSFWFFDTQSRKYFSPVSSSLHHINANSSQVHDETVVQIWINYVH